ncbi:MBL fold metallo-hydrolase [Clostridium vitabionis]|uniref:MBL fold metallo-hydrolase n=1 Tax=Clostridium vitabionis TaxID=2784388 RepID=UPI00188A5E1A|nr:MBL fold metallo-hydrolase [Clostridium vitabionis]
MEKVVRATLVSNAGLLVEYSGVKILVDAIYHTTDPFTNPPKAVWSAMLAGEHPFDGVDTLLFTHNHPDHFSPEWLKEYIWHRPVRRVFLPTMESRCEENLKIFLEDHGIWWTHFTPGMQMEDFSIPGGIEIRPYFTRHIDKSYWNVPHSCYLITIGKKSIFLTADVDYTKERFEQLSQVHIDVAFINPLFFSALQTGTFFKGILKPDIFCIYHVPSQRDDRWKIRSLLSHNLRQWNPSKGKIAVLDKPYQYVEV